MIINNETENFVDATEFEKEFGTSGVDFAPAAARGRNRWSKVLRFTIFIVALLATLIPVSVGEVHVSNTSEEVERYLMLHGYYAMTAQELLEVIKQENIEAYWTGPVEGAKYALDTSEIDRVTLRYLATDDSIDDIDSGTRMISTYRVKDGFHIIQKAAVSEGATSFTNINGDTVFYFNQFPKNVYMSSSKKDIEIEIYDREPGRSLILAATVGLVRPI